jgi:16S rRNA C1402 (ribose-2'-O) methylase RsmI
MTSKFIIGCNHIGSYTDTPHKVLEYLNSGNFLWVEHEDELIKDLEMLEIEGLTNYKVFTKHTLDEQVEQTISVLESGKDVMLLTHMGYPGTADPGSDLIKQIRSMGFEIEIIAGPSIAPLAVALSGIVKSEKGYLVRETFADDFNTISSYLEKIKDINELLVFIDFNHKATDIISLMLKVFEEDREASIIINGGLKNQLVISGRYTDIINKIESYPKIEIKKVVRLGYERETIEISEILMNSLTTIVSKGKS